MLDSLQVLVVWLTISSEDVQCRVKPNDDERRRLQGDQGNGPASTSFTKLQVLLHPSNDVVRHNIVSALQSTKLSWVFSNGPDEVEVTST